MTALPAARAAVDDAAACRQVEHPDRVLHAAAALLASWWNTAGGYGVSRDLLAAHADLPDAALLVIAAVDRERWEQDTLRELGAADDDR